MHEESPPLLHYPIMGRSDSLYHHLLLHYSWCCCCCLRVLQRPILLLLLFLVLPLPPHQCLGLSTDGVLLLSLKYSIISDPLSVLSNWNYYDDNPCSWNGITCSGGGAEPNGSTSPSTAPSSYEVTGISLPNSLLLGSIPSHLALIQHLQILDLSNNSINGTIPHSLFNITQLRVLDLSNNWLSGELPELVGGLKSIEILNLSDNALAGNLPRSLTSLPNLTTIYLGNNYFSGGLPGGFHRVRVLDVSSNLINGSLSTDFGGEGLEYFNISYNKLSGGIPAEFAWKIPANATLDFSYNNLTGEIPDSSVLLNQQSYSFSGNPDLCGQPLENPCPIPSIPAALPNSSQQPTSTPAIAAMPNIFNSSPVAALPETTSIGPHQRPKSSTLKLSTIAEIVAGDVAGIGIIALVFLLIYRAKGDNNEEADRGGTEMRDDDWSTSGESKGIAKWSCLTKQPGSSGDDDDEEEGSSSLEEECSGASEKQQGEMVATGTLVTVDEGEELEVETLLRASAYMLGTSGSSIMYKAVLEDGTALAVRRVGEGVIEKLKDFEAQVRCIAKLAHPNLVRIRGFYWGPNEKLVIYEFVPNGSLSNARHWKAGSSPHHIPWEVRLKIAKGVARGLTYLHEKKQVHGNLKPSNILLDADMEPKIGDLALERLVSGDCGYRAGGSLRHFGSMRSTASRESFPDIGATPSPSSSSIGCISPYHPPESLRSLKPNPKWDVYSFGVVLLELMTGKVIVPDENLGQHDVAGMSVYDKPRILRMADAGIRADLEGKEDTLLACLKLGCSCASSAPQKRPLMKEVLQSIEKLPLPSPISY